MRTHDGVPLGASRARPPSLPVICAVDDDALAPAVMETGVAVAERMGAPLVVVHCPHPDIYVTGEPRRLAIERGHEFVDRLTDGYDVDERIKDMNAGGVLACMCFPSFPAFSGRLFAACDDKELALAVVQAYNDWHIDDWCGRHPGRFIPMAIPVMWDPELAAAEVRRVAEKGCHSLTFTENPAALGYPSFHDPHWDPFWTAVCDEDVVVSIHLGSSGKLAMTAPDAPVDVMITLQPMNICAAAADLLWSRVLKEFPAIRIALSEGGTGWIPYFLDRLDRTYDMHHRWTGQDFGGRLPSEVFREHFLTFLLIGLADRFRAMRLELLANFERQAGHGVVIHVRRNRLLFMGNVLLHLVLLPCDVACVLDLDLDLFGQHVVFNDPRAGE